MSSVRGSVSSSIFDCPGFLRNLDDDDQKSRAILDLYRLLEAPGGDRNCAAIRPTLIDNYKNLIKLISILLKPSALGEGDQSSMAHYSADVINHVQTYKVLQQD